MPQIIHANPPSDSALAKRQPTLVQVSLDRQAQIYINRKMLKWIVWAILALLILDRARLLGQFGFRYTDEDQSLLWYATSELEHGRLHEPCFYGQAYNSTLESVLALPLHLILRIPLPYGLPIVTCVLGLLPFFIIAFVAWRRGRLLTAAFVLLLPLALPLPYSMVTAIPRGFVTGLAAAGVAWWLFERERGYIGWVVAGFLSIMAGFLNPNASVFLLAVGISAWWKHWKRWQFYPTTLLGMAAAAPIPWWAYNFYVANPNYDLLRHPPLEFKWKFWHEGVNKLDLLMGHFSPIGDSGRLVLVGLGVLIAALIFVLHFRGAIAVLAASALCIYALGINRIHESSTPSIFLSGSRMFLAIPLVAALAIFWLGEGIEKFPATRWAQFLARRVAVPLRLIPPARWRPWVALGAMGLIIFAGVVIALIRHFDYKETILSYVRERRLEVFSQEDYEKSVAAIRRAAAEKNANVVLIAANQDKTLTYTIPALTDSKIETIFPPWERRTWRLIEESRNKPKTLLVYLDGAPGKMGYYLESLSKFRNVEIVSKSPFIISLDPGGKTTLEVARILEIGIRKFE